MSKFSSVGKAIALATKEAAMVTISSPRANAPVDRSARLRVAIVSGLTAAIAAGVANYIVQSDQINNLRRYDAEMRTAALRAWKERNV